MQYRELIHKNKKDFWAILDRYKTYDSVEKLSDLLKRPVNEEIFSLWHGVDGRSYELRQLWLHQAQPSGKCCGGQ